MLSYSYRCLNEYFQFLKAEDQPVTHKATFSQTVATVTQSFISDTQGELTQIPQW